jgi:hypothetical protein
MDGCVMCASEIGAHRQRLSPPGPGPALPPSFGDWKLRPSQRDEEKRSKRRWCWWWCRRRRAGRGRRGKMDHVCFGGKKMHGSTT